MVTAPRIASAFGALILTGLPAPAPPLGAQRGSARAFTPSPPSRTFVSKVGLRVVARSDAGVLGVVREVSDFRRFSVGRIEVEKVLHGERLPCGEAIVVMAGRSGYFTPPGSRMVLFLERRGPGQFRAVSRITLDTASGVRRFRILEKVLSIELSNDGASIRAARLKALFFRLLASGPRETRWLALRELTHLSRERIEVFRRRDLDRIELLGLERSMPFARTCLEPLARRLRRLSDGHADRVRFHRHEIESAGSARERIRRLLAALRELGAGSVPLLVPLLQDGSGPVRELAAFHLGRLGDPVAAAGLLRRERLERDPEVKAAMLEALGKLKSRPAVGRAAEALKDRALRRSAIIALARIGSDEARRTLKTFRADLESSTDVEDRACCRLVDFVFSDGFKRQEAAIEKLDRPNR